MTLPSETFLYLVVDIPDTADDRVTTHMRNQLYAAGEYIQNITTSMRATQSLTHALGARPAMEPQSCRKMLVN
jgi:hypothetical protein